MPRRKGGRRPDDVAGLPEEILQEILARLPAKSVLRCRAVCRRWRRLTSDAAFLVEHHRRQPTLHLIRSFSSVGNHPSLKWLDAFHVQGGELLRKYWPRKYLFYGSCDGLVVTGGRICNPATRQWAPLSRKAGVPNFVGLFRHQPSGEYRVLFWRRSSVPSAVLCPNEYCVLTVGSDNNPRPVNPPTPVEVVNDAPILFQGQPVELQLINGEGPAFIGAPVILHGNMHLHWRRYSDGSGPHHEILVFDTVAESFRHMRPPAVKPCHVMQLFDMDGTLAASSCKDPMMEMRIFALQDYKSEVWSFQFRIKLPEVEVRRFHERHFVARIVSAEADLLVTCFGWLMHCDKKGNLVAKFRYEDDLPMVMSHVLKESLIQHTFFQKD